MFNLNQNAEDGQPNIIALKMPAGSNVESVEVRWPTDAEWCQRHNNIRSRYASTGRDIEPRGDNRIAVCLDLFRQICLNGHGETVNEAEAFYVIDRLETAAIISIERIGGSFEIRLKVMRGGITVHTLKPPNQKRVLQWKRAADPDATVRGGNIEQRRRLEPTGQLYDELVEKTEGYAAAIPIIHKQQVVLALIREIDRLASEDDEEDEQFPED